MANKQAVGEAVAYLFFAGFSVLLFPLVGPYIMYTNWNGYAEKLDRVPGIRDTGGLLSGFSAVVYVFVGVALVGSMAVAASGGLSGFTSPVAAEQPGGGTGGTGSGGTGGDGTVGTTPTGTDSGDLVEAGTEDPPAGPSEAELRAEEQRYEEFGKSLASDAEGQGVSTVGVSADAEEDIVTIQYRPDDIEDTTALRDEQRVFLTLFAEAVGDLDSDSPEYALNDIPSTVELVGLDSSGEVHHRGEILFSSAYSYSSGSIEKDEYERRFFSSVESV